MILAEERDAEGVSYLAARVLIGSGVQMRIYPDSLSKYQMAAPAGPYEDRTAREHWRLGYCDAALPRFKKHDRFAEPPDAYMQGFRAGKEAKPSRPVAANERGREKSNRIQMARRAMMRATMQVMPGKGVVQHIHAWRALGGSYESIAIKLNNLGITKDNGGTWNKRDVHRVASKPLTLAAAA